MSLPIRTLNRFSNVLSKSGVLKYIPLSQLPLNNFAKLGSSIKDPPYTNNVPPLHVIGVTLLGGSIMYYMTQRESELQIDTLGVHPELHIKARGVHPDYPQRFFVPDTYVPMNVVWPEYKPIQFTHDAVISADYTVKVGGWADPIDPKSIKINWDERCAKSNFQRDNGYPQNPSGRTGICGRGLLGKWGPNYAADPIVTRFDPITGNLQMAAILRKDTNQWAIPGGMVDAGELVSRTLRREFKEEAGNFHGKDKVDFDKLVDELFKTGKEVYSGYTDDPRNTDNAWIETNAFHFHCNKECATKLVLKGGDEGAVKWMDITQDTLDKLYGGHKILVKEAIKSIIAI